MFIQTLKNIIPKQLFLWLQPLYHRFLSWLAAVWYWYPSRHLSIVGITGTNGKATTGEMLAEIIEEAGYRVASVSSIRFRIAEREKPNDRKMTMPGRFFMQKFLRDAVNAGCTHAVLEVTSEGIKQFRHKHINFAMAVLTNITPEHIEAHGSFEAYRAAKAELFKAAPVHILNKDNKESFDYLSAFPATKRYGYTLSELPEDIKLHLPGVFNQYNALAALTAAHALGILYEAGKRALERIDYIPGRLEVVQAKPFGVVVDYAHTPDALEKVYASVSGARLICVLGSAGGGRDKWKRPEMGRIAAEHCDTIILTNEDSYDEDPTQILSEIKSGISNKFQISNLKIIIDRRLAIREAISYAKPGDVVIITGKGCETVMMGPEGEKILWDDREVVREELEKLKNEKAKGKR